jgi:TolB-like protein/class 3 adenylate cyclase
LAAIVAADVAGYSRLMGLDEVGTARTLREHRRVTDALVAKHGGRLVKATGDGVLLEFPSVVDAVECAVAVQAAMAQRNEGIPQDRRMLFRIGINLGDILIEGEDILGDGVNVAARLEGIAEPGGICVSSSSYEQVQGKVDIEFTDLGEQSLKNISRPVRAYAVARNEAGPRAHGSAATSSHGSAPRLSIVVLPFANLGGDPEQEYFVDGVTESLTTDLSRINGAFVIARNTAFTFKGKAIDVKKLGCELNVRYVLEGSVQRGANRLRVNVQLIDAETGNHLWAERFDKPVADLFDMQDEIVSRLANQLQAQLTEEEARRSEQSPHPSSMDLFFQGRALLNSGYTSDHLAQARDRFERAQALDPKNVDAMVWTAMIDMTVAVSGVTDNAPALHAKAEATLVKALSFAPNHAVAHLGLGIVLLSSKRAAQGIAECERALALDRNLAEAHAQIGLAKFVLGREAETEGHVNDAFRLSPGDVFGYRWLQIIGHSKFQAGEYAEAVRWLHRSVEANRNFPFAHFVLAAALAHADELDEARASAQAGLAINPSFTIGRYRGTAYTDNPIYLAGRERLYEGMRLAGVPEG